MALTGAATSQGMRAVDRVCADPVKVWSASVINVEEMSDRPDTLSINVKSAALLFWLATVLIVWLIPLLLIGSRSYIPEWLPHRVRMQAGCAALFTSRNVVWGQPIYLVRTKSSDEWREVDRFSLSPLQIAGYRTRMDRFVQEAERRGTKEMWERLCRFIANTDTAHASHGSEITGVRVLRYSVDMVKNPSEMKEGRWYVPKFEELDKKRLKLVAEGLRVGDSWKLLRTPKQEQSSSRRSTMASKKIIGEPGKSSAGASRAAQPKRPLQKPPLILKSSQNRSQPTFVRPSLPTPQQTKVSKFSPVIPNEQNSN